MTPWVDRLVVGVLVAGFMIGTATHVVQLISVGWVTLPTAPVWMNIYWASLAVLDPIAAMLLLRRRRAGLVLGLAIMVSDVAINLHAFHGLGLPFRVAALYLQTLFLGFLLGCAFYLWSRSPPPAR